MFDKNKLKVLTPNNLETYQTIINYIDHFSIDENQVEEIKQDVFDIILDGQIEMK